MEKTVFTFGRLNPPTVGHEKLVDKVKQVAKRLNAEPHVFLSHSQNSKKDPLNYNQKFKYAKQAFGNIVTKSNARTVIQIMQELEKMNHKDVVMIVGSDRVQEFRALLNKYNGKDYNFNSIKVVSAGERDPDAEGVSGMSASKMRAAVSAGDQASFMKGVPSKLPRQSAARMYSDLRSAMNITEDFNDFDWELWAETVDIDNIPDEELLEAVLSFAQRIKRARNMKRLAPRMKNLRRIKKFRMADKNILMKRAKKQAIKMFRKRVAGEKGEHYASLSTAAKISIDKMVQHKGPAITKLAQRLLPKIRKAEMERLRSARKSTNESLEEGNKAQLGIPANATNAQLRKIRSSDSSSKEQKQRAHWLLNMRKEEDESLDEKCWPGYKEVGGKMKNGKMVPNCVPEELDDKDVPKVKKIIKKLKGASKAHAGQAKDLEKAVNEKPEVPQDQDIKDRKGTQPKKYFKDLSKSTKTARDAHFKKYAKKDDSNPDNYKPAPGDKKGKTKPSVHTKKYKQMYGEDYNTPAAEKVDGNKTYKRFAALTDLDLNTYNRNLTIDEYSYGPANPDNEKDSQMFWEKKADLWNCSVDQVKSMRCNNCSAFNQSDQVKKMMSDALGPKGKDITEMADLGYCEFFEFKCAGARTCDAWVGGGPLKESNGQTDDVADIVPDRIRISMISGSKKRMLNDKFEKMAEQDIAARVSGPSTKQTAQRHSDERQRLKDKHARERETLKNRQTGQKDRAQIRDIRKESLDDLFEVMQRRQQKGSSSIVPRDDYMLDEKQIDALKKKAEKSGISYGTLKKVYDRGMAAWKSGHRPGTTPQQWAFARVNSFVTKSKGTWGGADKDLASNVRKESLDESFQMQVQQPAGYGQMVTAKEAGINIQAGFAFHPSVSEEGGAGEFGTDKLVKKYKQETPGEDLKEQSWIQFESCCEDCMEELMITEAEYEGKKVKLNDPIRTSENPKKKFKVYVRDPSSGNIKVVRFGDPGLSIKRDDPGRRRNFRARHNCDNPGPITKARYWSCRMWSKRTVSSLD